MAALLAVIIACTPKAMPLTAAHPANPAAPVGRLAGPPPALRPGVVAPAPQDPQPAPAAQQGHEGHH